MQIINISSSLGSIGTLQGSSLDAEEGSLPAMLSHYHLAYRSSKAALNMRKTHALYLGLTLREMSVRLTHAAESQG